MVLGLRPEAARVNPDEAVGWSAPLTTELVEAMGADTLLHFTLTGQVLVARTDGKRMFARGDPVTVSFEAGDIFLFDAETEERI